MKYVKLSFLGRWILANCKGSKYTMMRVPMCKVLKLQGTTKKKTIWCLKCKYPTKTSTDLSNTLMRNEYLNSTKQQLNRSGELLHYTNKILTN